MRLAITLLLCFFAAPSAGAQSADEFGSIVARSADGFIRPGYERLAGSATAMRAATAALCAAPSQETLDGARRRFAGLVEDWSRMELIRFGPVRENNRHERLDFWPDRKGLGLRQVQRLLAAKDVSATDVAALRRKSVAVQGLGALEFVLFGTGSDGLSDAGGAFRCSYGRAIAGAIAETASELAAAWKNEAGYAALMTGPGAGNPVYKTDAEAVQELLRCMTEEAQFVRDVKLAAILGPAAGKARPKRAPFRRAGLTVAALSANLESVYQLFEAGGFIAALPAEDAWLLPSIRFEIDQVNRHFNRAGNDFTAAVRDEEKRKLMQLAIIGVNGVGEAIGGTYTERTGLAIGFNSLDGD